MNKLALFAIGLCLTLVLACSGVSEEGTTKEQEPPSPHNLAGPPETTAFADGTSVEMSASVGTYCWTNACVDYIVPITRALLPLVNSGEVVVTVPADLKLREVNAFLWPATGPQALPDQSATAWVPARLPNELPPLPVTTAGNEVRVRVLATPGQHVLVVGMWFESGGDVQYAVLLNVR